MGPLLHSKLAPAGPMCPELIRPTDKAENLQVIEDKGNYCPIKDLLDGGSSPLDSG